MAVSPGCNLLLLMLLLSACQSIAPMTSSDCRPLGYERPALLSLKANDFRIDDSSTRNRFALALLDCLGHPDPQIRDGVAYEAYVTLLRDKRLAPDTIAQLRVALLAMLDDAADDPLGFRKPFAALVLAEVARADRIDAMFSDQQRAALVQGAADYMRRITDYRGYDETQGWRHGVAHTADLLMQLALNDAVSPPLLLEIGTALGAQIAPLTEHFYIYGEYERLARAVYYLGKRNSLSDAQWSEWFARLAAPAPFSEWADVWSSQAGLAKLHNTKLFAETLYFFISANPDPAMQPLLSGSLAVLESLP